MNKHLCLVSAAVLFLASCASQPVEPVFADTPASPAPSASPSAPPSTAPTLATTQALVPTTGPSTRVSAMNPVIATVGPVQVTREQIIKPLVDAYGLNILLNVLQLEIAKVNVASQHLAVTPDDIQREREQTIDNMFKEANEKLIDKMNDFRSRNMTADADKIQDEIKHDNDQAFEQFLTQQHLSRAEFDIVIETNANLRKLAEPLLKGKISDDNLHQAFNALYGETVKCRHIQCNNLAEIQEAKRQLAAGKAFAQVAMDVSRNPTTGPLGGELPPFSLQTQGFPENFKAAAFALKEGEVSDIVQAEGAYHLILLEKRIPPKAVKFDDVKESLRADLQKRALEAAVKELRQQLSEQAVKGLTIEDPELKKQWTDRLAKREGELKKADEIRKQHDRERGRAASQPAGSDLTLPPPAPLLPPAPVAPPASAPSTAPAAK